MDLFLPHHHTYINFCPWQERFAVNHASKDLGPEFVAFYKNLMLVNALLLCVWSHDCHLIGYNILQGQAQECFVEKSLKGVGRVKNNTVAKLAARVNECHVSLPPFLFLPTTFSIVVGV